MTDLRLLSGAHCPSATFLLNQTQISSPRLAEQLASLDRGSRAIVLDRRKERIIVVSRDGREITEVFAQTDHWGWVRGDLTSD